MCYRLYSVFDSLGNLNGFGLSVMGVKGKIDKVIGFVPIEAESTYSLSLGDKIPLSDRIDDFTVSDNGDRDKVMFTVLDAIDRYTARYIRTVIFYLAEILRGVQDFIV